MGKTVKCNSRSSDSITKACYVITIVSLFQINNFIICDSIFEERQKYTGSVYPVFIHRHPVFSFRYLRFPSPNSSPCIALIALHLPLAMVVLLSLIPISMSWLAKCVTTLSQNRVERVCASSNRVHCHSFVHVCFPFFPFRFSLFPSFLLSLHYPQSC